MTTHFHAYKCFGDLSDSHVIAACSRSPKGDSAGERPRISCNIEEVDCDDCKTAAVKKALEYGVER